jgi:hypothetical protein
MRRVVASSDSKSGNSRACGLSVDGRADFLADVLDPFLAAFLGNFFADLLDFLDDLERADVLAMNGAQMKGL